MTDHAIVSLAAQKELGLPMQDDIAHICSCGARLNPKAEDPLEAHKQEVWEQNRLKETLKKIRDGVDYYRRFGYPGSYYVSNPGAAMIEIYYKDMGRVLDYISELERKAGIE